VITRNTASVPAHQYLRTPTNSAHTAWMKNAWPNIRMVNLHQKTSKKVFIYTVLKNHGFQLTSSSRLKKILKALCTELQCTLLPSVQRLSDMLIYEGHLESKERSRILKCINTIITLIITVPKQWLHFLKLKIWLRMESFGQS
jgi:hypothetical protein